MGFWNFIREMIVFNWLFGHHDRHEDKPESGERDFFDFDKDDMSLPDGMDDAGYDEDDDMDF